MDRTSSVVVKPSPRRRWGRWLRILLCTVLLVILGLLALIVLLAEKDRHYSYRISLREMYKEQPLRPLAGAYNELIRATTARQAFIPLDCGFPAHTLFEKNWQAIAQEAWDAYTRNQLPAFHDVHEAFNDISSASWKVFVLKWYDKPVEANMAQCPVTASCIQSSPQVKAAMFSILQPGTRIPPHRGPSCSSLRYHLGLRIPKAGTARICVDNIWYYWKEGEGVLFDDTFEHQVVNDTKEIRIVLFMDVIRPLVPGLHELNEFLADHAKISEFVATVNARSEVQEKIQ